MLKGSKISIFSISVHMHIMQKLKYADFEKVENFVKKHAAKL